MPVIFDEVTATIEPPAPPPQGDNPESDSAPEPEADEAELRWLLSRMTRREARLRAD